MAKKTIEDMHIFAKEYNSKCLEKSYENADTDMMWECRNGHKFSEKYKYLQKNIKRRKEDTKNLPCKVCDGVISHTIEDMRKFANEYGGLCLEKSYINNQTKMRWQCSEGHVSVATYSELQIRIKKRKEETKNLPCKACNLDKQSPNTKTIEDMHKFAKEYGSKCLESTYIDNKTKMRWQCSEGHIVHSTYNALQNNIRKRKKYIKNISCKICHEMNRYTIKDLQEFAETKNGNCLSKEYKSYEEKILWQCCNKHIWPATWDHVKNSGSWCPTCAKIYHLTENKVRICFESFLGKKFPSKWGIIKNPITGNKLELDGYCKKLKIAFEYQGEHHYKKTNYCKTPLLIIQERDIYKQEACKKLGIKLYVIENLNLYYQNDIDHLINDIRQKCLNIDSEITNISNELLKEKFNQHEGALKEMQDYAEARGGRCNSDVYINARHKVSFTCKCGYSFETTPDSIRSRNNWCPKCAGKGKHTIEDMYQFARKFHGECLSKQYKNKRTKITWKCCNGHIFDLSYDNMNNRIKRNYWCLECKKSNLKECTDTRINKE
jgi:hypothetical protein